MSLLKVKSGLALPSKITEDDDRGISHGSVMPCENRHSGGLVDAEDRDVVRPLVARVEERPRRIETEAAGIIAPGPFLADEGQRSRVTDGKHRDAVVQAVARIDKPAIGGNHDLRAEVAPGKPRWEAGDGLPRTQPAGGPLVVKEHDVGAFFLE